MTTVEETLQKKVDTLNFEEEKKAPRPSRKVPVKVLRIDTAQKAKTCVICNECIIGNEFSTNRWGHSYHLNCIKSYLEKKLKMGRISYKCPAIKCTICLEFKREIMSLFSEENAIKLNAFDFCHSKVRKGKRAMWCPTCRLVYVKNSSEDNLCLYWTEKSSYTITEVLLSSNNKDQKTPTEGQLKWDESLFKLMIEDLKKQVSKCDSCFEWRHPISNTQVRKCRCELRIYSKHHKKLISNHFSFQAL